MIDLQRILITGGQGMIGRKIPWGHKFDIDTLDVRQPAAIQAAIDKVQPSAILHLAAIDIHRAEKEPQLAYTTNVVGTELLARAAQASTIPFIFLS